ncbi:MAG: transglycosylase SLT domain-containing protein [Polyangia bacterium]
MSTSSEQPLSSSSARPGAARWLGIRLRLGLGLGLGLALALTAAGPLLRPADAAPRRPVVVKDRAREPGRLLNLVPPSLLPSARKAVMAYRSGDYALARSELLPLLAKPAWKALKSRDYLLYLLGESEALLGDESDDVKLWAQAAEHLRAAAQVSDSPLALLARTRAADCAYKLAMATLPPSEATARTPTAVLPAGAVAAIEPGYRAALQAGKSSVDAGTVRVRLAELLVRSGRHPEAQAILRRVYIDQPTHPLGEQALVRLRQLDAEAALSASERIARAKSLIQVRRWAEAILLLEGLPKEIKDLGPAVRDEIEYWLGTSFYRMRRNYEGAARKLLSVAERLQGDKQAEAMFHGARALSRADKDDEAIKGYQAVVQAHPRSSWAPEASFLTGWLEYNRGRYTEAIPALSETVKRFTGKFGDEARWYIGWSRYLLKDYAAAQGDFDQLGKRSEKLAPKAGYWAAMALYQQGKKPDAIERWRRIAEERPLSYYGLVARARLKAEGVTVGAQGDASHLSPDGLPDWVSPPDPAVLGDAQLVRPRELIEVGLDVEAGQELRHVEGALLKGYGAGRALPVLFLLYTRAMSFQRPHFLAEVHGAAALRRDPHGVPAARPYWDAMYPLAYRALIEKYAPSGDNPPRYLYSIMQKESAYNPHDVSYADAIGLLQMIPPTSRRVAPLIGRPYTDDVLYDPEGNIQFGAFYIGRLLKKFKGQVALGGGSFNAGPKAMIRWLGRSGDRTLDEFIELCPYTQTREYMKKLLDIYAHYVYLWDKEEYLPDLRVDKDYLKDDGIDY